jgi:23S rRNA (adenine2503-C2)-methyltransferase
MSTKVLFALPDGNAIETVRIRRRTGMTACVSSQVGCAFGCTFCASGKLGLQRHLRAGEIVQQVLELGPKVNRIVFMGIGEPLHNYDQVLAAIRILRDRRGLGLKTSGITISTIGIPAKRLRRAPRGAPQDQPHHLPARHRRRHPPPAHPRRPDHHRSPT